MKTDISIIIPVYNVEEYVGKAIKSIQDQSFSDWEMFLVDDGSTDKSGLICDAFAENDKRIHVIHKENGGAPSARNMAIDLAQGKYLFFMDADDWAENSMLEDLYVLAEKDERQLVITGFYIDTYYTNIDYYRQELYFDDRTYFSQQKFREESYLLFDRNLLYTSWNKLFLTSYIKKQGLYFPDTFWDDFPFVVSVIKDIDKVAVSKERYYHFIRKRAESETSRYRPEMYEKREQEDQELIQLYEYWGIDNEDVREFLARRYIERLIGCVENITTEDCNLSKNEKKAIIKEMINTDRAKETVRTARPRSILMKLMLLPIRWRITWLVYAEGKYISRVKSKNTRAFARLKANR